MEHNIIDIPEISTQNTNLNKHKYFTMLNIFILWGIYLGMIFFRDKTNFNSQTPNDNYPLVFRIFSECDKCSDLRKQIWRLYTYSCVHSDVYHLLFNSIIFILSCYCLENEITSLNIATIYILSVIFAALSHCYFKPYTGLIGSSGGSYSLIGTFIGIGIIDYFYFSEIKKNVYLILLAAAFIIFLIELYIFINHYDNSTAYHVHLFGFIYGILITNIIVKPRKNYTYHKKIKILSFIIFIIISAMLIDNYLFLHSAKKQKFSDQCCYIK